MNTNSIDDRERRLQGRNVYMPHPLMINSGTFWRCAHGNTGIGGDGGWDGCDDCLADIEAARTPMNSAPESHDNRHDVLCEALSLALQYVPLTEKGVNPELDRIYELIDKGTKVVPANSPTYYGILPVAGALYIDGKYHDPFIVPYGDERYPTVNIWREPNMVKLYTDNDTLWKQMHANGMLLKAANAMGFMRWAASVLNVDFDEQSADFVQQLMPKFNELAARYLREENPNE